jgi:HK97 family phage portal protein
MTEELSTKQLETGEIGDSTNLPAAWNSLQESLWETLTFQRNYNPLPYRNEDALAMAIAYICADVKARDIAKSDMSLLRQTGRRKNEYVQVLPREHWFAKLLNRRPNIYHSWTEFWRMTVVHLGLSQNAYILKEMDRTGQVTGLLPLPPGRVSYMVNPTNGRFYYEILSNTDPEKAQVGNNDRIVVPDYMMIHLKGRFHDGINGLSNYQLGHPLFSLMDSVSRFQRETFTNDGRMPIVFESDSAHFGVGDQADAAFRRLKAQLSEATRKMRAYGEPILLEAGYKAKIIAQNARESMSIESSNATIMRICALMEVPPHKIFAYESVKYENMSAANEQYANDHLIPIAKNIEEKFRLSLMGDEEIDLLYPWFDRLPFMAGDTKTLMESIDKALGKGLMTINEGRELLPFGLNPLKAGDVRMVPVNMALVDEDGNVVQQAASGQPNNDGETEAPVDPEQATRALVRAVREGVELAATKFPKPIQPPPAPSVNDAIREMGYTLVQAMKAAPQPQITVPVSVVMPKKGKEVTTVLEHDEAGRIRRFEKQEVED